jgi:polyamine oxidase
MADISRRQVLQSIGALSGASVLHGSVQLAKRMPTPNGALVTHWNADPWARGSYAVLRPGATWGAHRGATRVATQRFVLAGEAFDPVAPGTMHGALRSGRQAANELHAAITMPDARPVLIVGAGLAGLSAAQRLRQLGHQVLVIDARNRLGGRVATSRTLGRPVELGAAWIHGTSGNELVNLVAKQGLSQTPTNYDDLIVRLPSRSTISPSVVAAAQRQLSSAVERAQAEGEDSMSLQAGLDRIDYPSTALANWALTTEIVHEYADDPIRLNLEHFNDDEDPRGGDVMVGGGLDRLVAKLAEGLPLRLSCPATLIRPSGLGVEVVTKTGAISGSSVVVTAPIGVLQSGGCSIDWSGFGAQSQFAAMQQFSMGDLEKVILTYPKKFWPKKQLMGLVGTPSQRFAEVYDLSTPSQPMLVAFTAGAAARSLPSSDTQTVALAQSALSALL